MPSITFAHRIHRPFVTILLLAVATGAFAQGGAADHATHRHDHVREMGAAVMPFDLEKTLHGFVHTVTGGEQVVVVRDTAADADQVPLVRSHLREIAAAFASGDFGDPATIHGDDMPGLDVLRERFAAVTIRFFSLPDGAIIVYDTDDDDVVAALHAWFGAQVGDHGMDAVMGQIDSLTTEALWRDLYPAEPTPASFAGR